LSFDVPFGPETPICYPQGTTFFCFFYSFSSAFRHCSDDSPSRRRITVPGSFPFFAVPPFGNCSGSNASASGSGPGPAFPYSFNPVGVDYLLFLKDNATHKSVLFVYDAPPLLGDFPPTPHFNTSLICGYGRIPFFFLIINAETFFLFGFITARRVGFFFPPPILKTPPHL